MTTTKHTEGKLRVRPSDLVPTIGYHLETDSGYLLGSTTGEANAHRLALCWNSHDALVEALEAIHIRLHAEVAGRNDSPWLAAMALAREALSQTKAQETP